MAIERILVVDDERLTGLSLVAYLEESGYTAAYASSGKAALYMQREQPFDLCIVDVRMPGMDGIETVIALHRIAPGTRLVIYTGSPQFELSGTLIELGLSEEDIVRKPVLDMALFVDLIARKNAQGKG